MTAASQPVMMPPSLTLGKGRGTQSMRRGAVALAQNWPVVA